MRSPFELKSLVEWLEKQPADEEYEFFDSGDCLCAQYLRFIGLPVVTISAYYWYDGGGARHSYPYNFNVVARGVGYNWDRTFGGALSRARALLAAEARAVTHRNFGIPRRYDFDMRADRLPSWFNDHPNAPEGLGPFSGVDRPHCRDDMGLLPESNGRTGTAGVPGSMPGGCATIPGDDLRALPARPRPTPRSAARRQPTAYYVAIGLLLGILLVLAGLYAYLDQIERALPAPAPPLAPVATNVERFA